MRKKASKFKAKGFYIKVSMLNPYTEENTEYDVLIQRPKEMPENEFCTFVTVMSEPNLFTGIKVFQQ